MSMKIGKGAREALRSAVFDYDSEGSEILERIRVILNRCTDADEGGQEAVAWRAEVDGQWFVSKTQSALKSALSDAGVAREPEPLYTRPPVGLPAGWRIWKDANGNPAIQHDDGTGCVATNSPYPLPESVLHHFLNAMLSAAPPCPGVVSLSEDINWPMISECLRNYAALLESGEVDGAGHYFPEGVYEQDDHLVRWIESHGQERIEAAGEQEGEG